MTSFAHKGIALARITLQRLVENLFYCLPIFRPHGAGAPFFSRAGQLTRTVSGSWARSGLVSTRMRCPSELGSYVGPPVALRRGNWNNSRGAEGSTVSVPSFRLTDINLFSGDR